MSEPPESHPSLPADLPTPVKHLEVKAAFLLVFMLVVVASAVMYLLYARGAFEKTQRLYLMADNSEGVHIGMDMTFSGFPIGRVRHMELASDGRARIVLDVPLRDAHWLRKTSVFTLERGLVGGTNIRAFTGMMQDDLLEDGAERTVHRGDAAEAIPLILSSVRDVLGRISAMTAEDAALRSTLRNLKEVSDTLKGPHGALGVVMGNPSNAQKIVEVLNRSNALLAKVDALTAKADAQMFGPQGVMNSTQATVQQLNGLLADARNSLKKVDAVLIEAQGIAANTKESTVDLGALRGDVESSLRKVDSLVNEINRKWPFARDADIKLP